MYDIDNINIAVHIDFQYLVSTLRTEICQSLINAEGII